MSGQGFGVVCEKNGDRVKLFDFWTKKMVDMEAPKRDTVYLGDIRRTDTKGLGKVLPGMVNMSCSDFGVDGDGALVLKTMVVCPRPGLLEKEFGEYESKVFSYLFEFVNDPKEELSTVFAKGGFRWVLLKYNPRNGNHFEVVKRLEGAEIPGAPKEKENKEQPEEEQPEEKEQPEEREQPKKPANPPRVKKAAVFKVPMLPMGGKPGGFKLGAKKH